MRLLRLRQYRMHQFKNGLGESVWRLQVQYPLWPFWTNRMTDGTDKDYIEATDIDKARSTVQEFNDNYLRSLRY